MGTDLIEGNVESVLKDLLARVAKLETIGISVQEVSEIADDLGMFMVGELRVPFDYLDPKEPGEGFSGVRIMDQFEYPEGSGDYYAIVGVNNDALMFGLSAETGAGVFGGGNITLDIDGITGTDLLKHMIKQTATNDSNERTGKLEMVLIEGGAIPIWQLSYASPAGAELMNNGDFEDGDFTGWTETTETNGAWEIDDAVMQAGSYSAKWMPTADGDGNSKILLHFDGTDASTTFTDENGRTWTAHGNAQIDTAQKVFGTASGLFDGTGDYIDTPDSADFTVGSGDFEIECRIRVDTLGTSDFICAQADSSATAASRAWGLAFDDTDNTKIIGVLVGGATFKVVTSPTATIAADTWYAVSLSRYNNILTLRVDGVTVDTLDITGFTVNNSSSKLAIGRFGESNTNYFDGWVDEFRFTKGTVRHTADYTPAVAAYEDVITEGILTSDRVAVSASTDYLITTYIKNTGLAGTISAVLKWYDDPAAGSLLQTETIGLVNTSGSFQEYSISSESPATAESCEVILTCLSTNAYEINFDTISISALTVNQKLQLTDDGLATTNGLYPTHAVMWFGNFDIVSGTPSIGWSNNINAFFGGYFVTTSGQDNGDSYEHTFTLKKGTYSIRTRGASGTSRGKIDFYIDGVLVIDSQDWYGSTAELEKIETSISVATSGRHTLTLTVDGKNGSSSGYLVGLSMIDIY